MCGGFLLPEACLLDEDDGEGYLLAFEGAGGGAATLPLASAPAQPTKPPLPNEEALIGEP